ncbi:MAG: hypothetical protein KF846_16590 [Cyclobacteriaceae bacterium]|nr:hypothetical protein [Cyclobacteriaceae bacterium]
MSSPATGNNVFMPSSPLLVFFTNNIELTKALLEKNSNTGDEINLYGS